MLTTEKIQWWIEDPKNILPDQKKYQLSELTQALYCIEYLIKLNKKVETSTVERIAIFAEENGTDGGWMADNIRERFK